MVMLGTLLLVLKIVATLLSIYLGGRKLCRLWKRRRRNKRKPTA